DLYFFYAPDIGSGRHGTYGFKSSVVKTGCKYGVIVIVGKIRAGHHVFVLKTIDLPGLQWNIGIEVLHWLRSTGDTHIIRAGFIPEHRHFIVFIPVFTPEDRL